jgi:hypothetical protein
MHTLWVLAGGLALLGVCLFAGRLAGTANSGLATGTLAFLPLWLVGAAINMWFGVAKARYSMREELPIFLIIFAVPAAAALAVRWIVSR